MGASVDLAWDPSTASNIVGYNVYYGAGSHSYQALIPVGNKLATTVPGLADGTTYYFSVTAVDAFGVESDYSTELAQHTTGNATPTISMIADQAVNIDQSTPAIAFTVSDVETPAASLTVTAGASDDTLIPAENIVLGGSGANRTVTVTPAAGLSGSTAVSIIVSDGTNVASRTFNITVSPSGSPAPNTPPTISAIASQTVNQGQATAAISFTIGDAETAAANLTLTKASSSTTLVPFANIVLGGSGANRTVTVTPASGQSGSAQITITVGDGTNTASSSFTLTVRAATPNTAPTISAMGAQTVTSGQATAAIPFTIGDAETAAASLTLTKASSSTTLVPTANIVFGGSGANRTVTVTPVAGKTGAATITVTVSDGTNTASSAFTLTVQAPAPNTAPTISAIGAQAVTSGQATAAIPFTIGDAETAATSLTVSGTSSSTTLVPTANIVFGGAGANRTVTVTPVAGRTGSATITVKVSDGTNTTSSAFALTVSATPVNTAPTISTIPPQTISVGQSTVPLPFTISDAETAAANLAVSAVATDTTLVPNGNITLGGAGANRTVTVTPTPGQTGSAIIKVSVNDGTNTTISSFTLTVQLPATNSPPTISTISDQVGYVDTALGPVPFTIGDSQTPAANLSVSVVSSAEAVVPSANIVLGGNGANRTLSLTPAAGQVGVAQITITVSDGTNSAQASFNVTIEQPTVMTKSSLPPSSTYNGLFYESDAVRTRSAGQFKVTVSASGKYSGQLIMTTGKYPFSGQFGVLCQGTNIIVRRLATTLTVQFSLNPDGSINPFAGNISDGTWTAGMQGARAAFNAKTNPAPYGGTYTLAVPSQDFDASIPVGNSYGSVRVDGSGNIKFSGVLADGTKVTQGSQLSEDGMWPLFVPLYKGQGLVMAWVSFANRTTDDLHGGLNWLKQPNLLSKYYPAGFTLEGNAVGSLFSAPSALVLNADVAQLQSNGGAASVVTAIKVSRSTGTFKGSLMDKTTGKLSKFQGALLLKTQTGYGFILEAGQSAPLTLTQ
jgi:fibronectin type 3 domain-containing protein